MSTTANTTNTTSSSIGDVFAEIIGQSQTQRFCPYCKQPLKAIDVRVGKKVFRGLSCWASCGCERALRDCEPQTTSKTALKKLYIRAGIGTEYQEHRIECADLIAAVKNAQNVFITGDNGTGKSTLAASVAMTLMDEGMNVLFVNAAIEARAIRDSFNNGGTDSYERMATAPVLILDDLGKDNPTEWSTSLWYTVAEARNAAKLPTVTTSNYDGGPLVRRLLVGGDDSSARAIVSRLCGGAYAVKMHGHDRRLS